LKEKKKVGIPRALIYYKFKVLWKTFLEELGVEVIISDETTKKTREIAIQSAPDEDCYSTKIFHGHALELKDKVDYLFVPRFASMNRPNMGCPKFIALADVLKSMYPDLPTIIAPHYDTSKHGHTRFTFINRVFQTGFNFTKNPFKILKAYRRAMKAYKKYKENLIIDKETLQKWELSEIVLNDPPKNNPGEKTLKIALVGHSYVINDNYQSFDIRKRLAQQGVDIITSEQMPRELIETQLAKLDNNLYFEFEREILGTIMHFLETNTVDGIIHLIIFGCGPDSLAGDLASKFAKRNPQVQLLQLVFDDLTAEAGMKTRIEAFVDMLRRRKDKDAIYIPTLRVS
jgi:predicted nucleotide-binding protein (sugar kinase/HSP70/actin superfamily)